MRIPYPTGLPGISWPQPATWQKVPAKSDTQNYHQHNSYQPIVYIGNSINKMHTYQHGRTQQHDRCGLARLSMKPPKTGVRISAPMPEVRQITTTFSLIPYLIIINSEANFWNGNTQSRTIHTAMLSARNRD